MQIYNSALVRVCDEMIYGAALLLAGVIIFYINNAGVN